MNGFPTDETTLTLLEAACRINPDSGHTELQSFLDMGSRVKSTTLLEDIEPPVYFVEHEPGFEPWSETQVIGALIAEIRRLRAALQRREQ